MTRQYIKENLLNKNGGIISVNLKKLNMVPEELYKIYYDIDTMKCPVCNKNRNFINFKVGYTNSCGNNSCAQKIEGVQDRKRKTTLEKHGSENFNNREKSEKTCLLKYGSKNVSGSDIIKQMKKETCIKNYGVDNPLKSKVIQEKSRITCLNKYGKEYYLQSEDKKEKSKETNIEKFGSEFYLSSDVRRSRMENEGKWLKLDDLYDFELYCRMVRKETEKNAKFIKGIELRGHNKFNDNAYHLDHKYSKVEGFRNNILPSIIGGVKNLEMLHYKDNCSKREKCSVELKVII